jgi:hypothetical protein
MIEFKQTDTKAVLIQKLTKHDIACSERQTKDQLIGLIEKYNKTGQTLSKFSVEERFSFLSMLTQMLIYKKAKSLIVLGSGGIGKTRTVMDEIQQANLKRNELQIIKSYSTPRGLYNLLYDHNGKLLVFDDTDSILTDTVSQNILKSALDSHDTRLISWAAKMAKGDEYPQEFVFEGRIIFISNKNKNNIFQPLLTRSKIVDLELSPSEKIDRMWQILPSVCEENRIAEAKGDMAIEFIRQHMKMAKELSLRTLLDVVEIIKAYPERWEPLAEYTITEG